MRLKKNFHTAGSVTLLAAFMLLQTGWGNAGGRGADAIATELPAGQPKTAVQGMRVYRDPQTGRLGPPPAGIPPHVLTIDEQRMLNRSDQGLRPRSLPGGGVAVNLQGRYRNMAVATVGADGQAAVNCALTPDQAETALQAGQRASTGPVD